jgi:outer membrane protein TolC
MKRVIQILVGIVFINTGYTQQLESLLEQGLMNNPEIQALEIRYSIATEKVNEVNTLPNTEFSAGYFASETETRTGAQKARFGVKQMLPWFGTITARENYAGSMAEADFVDLVIAKRKLALGISQAYYRLYAINAASKVLEENVELLRTYEQLALKGVEGGMTSAVDVLQLQIRQNELVEQTKVLQQRYLAEESGLNNLLNRDESIPISILDTFSLPKEDGLIASDSLRLHPELLKYDKLYESVLKDDLLVKKEASPMLGIGVDYVPVAERTDVLFTDNGKDMVMPMVSVSVPIFNNRYSSLGKQNALRKKELEAMRKDRYNALKTQLAEAVSQRNSARIRFIAQSENLKKAANAEEILIKNYETGTIDFNDVLDIQELQLKFQMNQIEAVNSYYNQMAIINYLSNL